VIKPLWKSSVRPSSTQVDLAQPWWADYLPFIEQVKGTQQPDCGRLNSLLPEWLKTESGHSILFVPSTELDDGAYEQRIYNTGQVSTRPDNWHDIFNALVWMRFPRIKIAMNTLHFHAWPEQKDGARGKLRDALTLFDECGVLVFSKRRDVLRTVAERHWMEAFTADGFSADVSVSICGHAMLEKYLAPYKSMTAKALLVHIGADFQNLSREEMLICLDKEIAARMLSGTLLNEPACLTPLPLAGIPGWWLEDIQDDRFYNDPAVFRPPPAGLVPVPFIEL
jgi:hypothetical protein